jgi:hypothetical protein
MYDTHKCRFYLLCKGHEPLRYVSPYHAIKAINIQLWLMYENGKMRPVETILTGKGG